MKIKLDENLPVRLVEALAKMGHEADTVAQEGLIGLPDDVIWRAAQLEERFFVTQDLDFSDARKYAPGIHHGLLLVRLAVPGREALFEKILSLFRNEAVEDWRGCIVVATNRKLRIRRPAQ